jgi:hypothetical protein
LEKEKMGKLFKMSITEEELAGIVKNVVSLSSLYSSKLGKVNFQLSNGGSHPTLEFNRLTSVDTDDSLNSLESSSLSGRSSSFSPASSHFSDVEQKSLLFSSTASLHPIDQNFLLNPSHSQSPNFQYRIASNPLSPSSVNNFEPPSFNQNFSSQRIFNFVKPAISPQSVMDMKLSQPSSTFIENDEVLRLSLRKSHSFMPQNYVDPAIFGNEDICVKLIKRIESLKKENEALREELNGEPEKKFGIQNVLEKKKSGKIKPNVKMLRKSVEISSVKPSCSSSSFSPSTASIFIPHTISSSTVHDMQPTAQVSVMSTPSCPSLPMNPSKLETNSLIDRITSNSCPNNNRCYNCGEKGHLYVGSVFIFLFLLFLLF